MILGALSGHSVHVEVGDVYRRPGPGPMIEIAHVLEIMPDRMGIPHVRFELHSSRRGTTAPLIEERTLGLEAFQARFRERIEDSN